MAARRRHLGVRLLLHSVGVGALLPPCPSSPTYRLDRDETKARPSDSASTTCRCQRRRGTASAGASRPRGALEPSPATARGLGGAAETVNLAGEPRTCTVNRHVHVEDARQRPLPRDDAGAVVLVITAQLDGGRPRGAHTQCGAALDGACVAASRKQPPAPATLLSGSSSGGRCVDGACRPRIHVMVRRAGRLAACWRSAAYIRYLPAVDRVTALVHLNELAVRMQRAWIEATEGEADAALSAAARPPARADEGLRARASEAATSSVPAARPPLP